MSKKEFVRIKDALVGNVIEWVDVSRTELELHLSNGKKLILYSVSFDDHYDSNLTYILEDIEK